MNSHILFIILACLGSQAASKRSNHHQGSKCLESGEGEAIAKGWLKLWETDSSGKRSSPDVVRRTVTPDFELYDAGITPNSPDTAFLYRDRKTIEDDFANPSKWVSETDEKYTLILNVANCDTTVVRWEMHGKTGKHENT